MISSRSFLAAACVLALSACHPNKKKPLDPATLQTAAGEAALRYMLDACPKRGEAHAAVLMIGEYPVAPAPEFAGRFAGTKDIVFIGFDRVVAGMVGGMSRRFDRETTEPVLELQISGLTEPKNGVQEAVVAWAFKDDAERKRLELKAKSGGGYDIRELETIPVPPRNQDSR